MGKITDTVKFIIIINVLFFVGSMLTKTEGLFAVHYIENDSFFPWQILTHMFMHSHVFLPHILFNMLGVWMFGSPLEQIWGKSKFLFFYLSAGLGAYLIPLMFDYIYVQYILELLIENGFSKEVVLNTLNEGNYMPVWEEVLGKTDWEKFNRVFFRGSLGASGALMGILVAFGFMFPNAKLMLIFLPIPIKAKYFIPLLLAYDIISGFSGGTSLFGVSVDHWAHVAGAATGLFITLIWKKNSFNDKRWY